MFLFFGLGKKSKDEAKRRLNIILQYERVGISPSLIENLKKDIVSVLSKYPQLEANKMNLAVRSERERIPEIHINVPLRNF